MVSARTTVTLPEELNKRLEAVKTRINVSAICQEAIEKAVSLEEAKMNAATKRDAAIAKLKGERKKSNDEWVVKGREDGISDAPDLGYEDLKWLENLQQYVDGNHESGFDYAMRQIKARYSLSWLTERIDQLSEIGCSEDLKLVYLDGWMSEVSAFWDDIKQEVESLS